MSACPLTRPSACPLAPQVMSVVLSFQMHMFWDKLDGQDLKEQTVIKTSEETLYQGEVARGGGMRERQKERVSRRVREWMGPLWSKGLFIFLALKFLRACLHCLMCTTQTVLQSITIQYTRFWMLNFSYLLFCLIKKWFLELFVCLSRRRGRLLVCWYLKERSVSWQNGETDRQKKKEWGTGRGVL